MTGSGLFFILKYDENDDIFDHVPDLVAPPGTSREFIGGFATSA